MALQAHTKEQLLARLSSSLEAATDHLLWFLGMGVDQAPRKHPDLFRRYELNLTDGTWVESCVAEAQSKESVEYCIVRKLQALDAICSSPRLLVKEERRKAVKAALKQLGKQQEHISGVTLRRDPLPSPTGEGKRGDAEGFVFEEGAVGSGRKVLSPTVHAASMAVVVRCELAVGSQVKWRTIAQWFVAAEQAVAQVAPKFDKLSHHMLGIVWEALSFVAAQLPADHREQVEAAEKVVRSVEKPMRHHFGRGQKQKLWSYSGAAAVAFRANRSQPDSFQHKALWRLAADHVWRWHHHVSPEFNSSDLCMCGPVSGLAPLASALQDSRLAMAVIEMVDRDIQLFQVPLDFAAEEGANLGWLAKAPEPQRLRGAFGRHPRQLKIESRSSGIRVDDTGTCVAAVGAALKMVEAMLGIEDADLPTEVAAAIGVGEAAKSNEL